MSIVSLMDEWVQIRRAVRSVVTSTIRDVKVATTVVANMTQVKARLEPLAENIEFTDMGQVAAPLFRIYLEPGLDVRVGDVVTRFQDTDEMYRIESLLPIRNRRGDSHIEATAKRLLG